LNIFGKKLNAGLYSVKNR